MQHLQLELGIGSNLLLVEIHYAVVANAQTGSIEVEHGFFLRGNAYADIALRLHVLVQQVDFFDIVDDGYHIGETVCHQLRNVLDILRTFEAVA